MAQLFSLGGFTREVLYASLSKKSENITPMKILRTALIIGFAHSGLWWLCQAIIHIKNFTPYTNMPEYSSPVGRVAFDVQMIISYPFSFDWMTGNHSHYLQSFQFVTLDSCIWGLCLAVLFSGFRRLHHAPAA